MFKTTLASAAVVPVCLGLCTANHFASFHVGATMVQRRRSSKKSGGAPVKKEQGAVAPPPTPKTIAELRAEAAVVKRCQAIVDATAAAKEKEGLTSTAYTLGVLNTIVIAIVFAKLPGSFWVLYAVEALALFKIRWDFAARQTPQEQWYWMDFCWVMNFVALFTAVGAWEGLESVFGEEPLAPCISRWASDLPQFVLCMFRGNLWRRFFVQISTPFPPHWSQCSTS